MRKWLIGIITAAVLVATAGSAYASHREPPPGNPQSVSNDVFTVHYDANTVKASQAGSVLREANDCYFAIIDNMGYPKPPADSLVQSESQQDIFIDPLTRASAFFSHDKKKPPAYEGDGYTGVIRINDDFLRTSTDSMGRTLCHEYFHAIQRGMDGRESVPDKWWSELSAEWIGYATHPGKRSKALLIATIWSRSPLDCTAVSWATVSSCRSSGYSYWPYAEYLDSRFGSGTIRSVWLEQQRLGLGSDTSHARQAIDNVLAPLGSSFSDSFNGFAAASAYPQYGQFAARNVSSKAHQRIGRPWSSVLKLRTSPWTVTYVSVYAPRKSSKLVVEGDRLAGVTLQARNRTSRSVSSIGGINEAGKISYYIDPYDSKNEMKLALANVNDGETSWRVSYLDAGKPTPKPRPPRPGLSNIAINLNNMAKLKKLRRFKRRRSLNGGLRVKKGDTTGITSINVALRHKRPGGGRKCRWLKRSRFGKRTRGCTNPSSFLNAQISSSTNKRIKWTLRLNRRQRRSLRRGRYLVKVCALTSSDKRKCATKRFRSR